MHSIFSLTRETRDVIYWEYMENVDPNILQNFLQNNTDGSLTPTINIFPEELITTLTVGFYILTAVSVLFLIAYIVNSVRKWKVQSAILEMQKDVRDIKQSLSTAKPQTPIDKNTPKIA